MANSKRNTGKTNRSRPGTGKASSSARARASSRRRRSAASDDMMVLKLLLLVVAVLVVFEGRLIFTMFTQSKSPVITAVSGEGNGTVQTALVEKNDDSVPNTSDEGQAKTTEAAGNEENEQNNESGTGHTSSGSAIAGFPALDGTVSSAPAAPASESSVPEDSSSIYDENGYVISEHLDNACVVPMQSVSVDDSYFSDAVFIGDSRMEGFRFTSGITQGEWLTSVGMTLTSISDSKVATPDGNITVYQGLSGRQYGKIYLMLGANDLGFWPWEEFLPTALSVLEQFHELQPKAVIYICSCIYVEESKVVTDYVNNANVIEVNKGLLQACEQLDYCWYINLNEVLSNGWQSLIMDASEDGVHLYEHYAKIMLSYMKNHYLSDSAGQSATFAAAEETTEDDASAGDDAGGDAEAEASNAGDMADTPEPPPDDLNGIIIVN